MFVHCEATSPSCGVNTNRKPRYSIDVFDHEILSPPNDSVTGHLIGMQARKDHKFICKSLKNFPLPHLAVCFQIFTLFSHLTN